MYITQRTHWTLLVFNSWNQFATPSPKTNMSWISFFRFVTQDWLPKNGENQLHSWISVQVWVTEIRNHLVEGTLFFWALWTHTPKKKNPNKIHLFVVRDDFLSSWSGLLTNFEGPTKAFQNLGTLRIPYGKIGEPSGKIREITTRAPWRILFFGLCKTRVALQILQWRDPWDDCIFTYMNGWFLYGFLQIWAPWILKDCWRYLPFGPPESN